MYNRINFYSVKKIIFSTYVFLNIKKESYKHTVAIALLFLASCMTVCFEHVIRGTLFFHVIARLQDERRVCLIPGKITHTANLRGYSRIEIHLPRFHFEFRVAESRIFLVQNERCTWESVNTPEIDVQCKQVGGHFR